MELRFHGSFPPRVEDGTPGTITTKPKSDEQTKQQQSEDYEPQCLLQAWAEPREGGKIAYLFLMYSPQIPPWEIAQKIVRYFRLNPTQDHHHHFVECIPPNQELLKPIYTKYNFTWEWQQSKWTRRGSSWIWQSAGHGIVFPYSETPITAEEEAQYAQQLEQLLLEAAQESKPALPQTRQNMLLPTFSFSRTATKSSHLALEEKAHSTQLKLSSGQ